jgi:hypothetical protein
MNGKCHKSLLWPIVKGEKEYICRMCSAENDNGFRFYLPYTLGAIKSLLIRDPFFSGGYLGNFLASADERIC